MQIVLSRILVRKRKEKSVNRERERGRVKGLFLKQ